MSALPHGAQMQVDLINLKFFLIGQNPPELTPGARIGDPRFTGCLRFQGEYQCREEPHETSDEEGTEEVLTVLTQQNLERFRDIYDCRGCKCDTCPEPCEMYLCHSTCADNQPTGCTPFEIPQWNYVTKEWDCHNPNSK